MKYQGIYIFELLHNQEFGNPQFSKIKSFVNSDYISLLINSVIEGEVNNHIESRINKAARANSIIDYKTSKNLGDINGQIKLYDKDGNYISHEKMI